MLFVEEIDMTKSTVTRIWISGLVVLALGLIVAGLSIGLMLAYGGTFSAATSGSGYDFVPRYDAFFGTMVGLIVVGGIAAAVGGLIQLTAWIGALVNTYQLQDKTWFVVLLAGGLLGFAFGLLGFAAMVAYLIAGPDGMAVRQPRISPPTSLPSTLAPTS
jgi:hypothetical protein